MSGDCPRIVASSTSCGCVRPCSSKWLEKDFGMHLKQLSREELEMEFYSMHTKNECLSKAFKDNAKQIKRLNKIIKKNEEDRKQCLSPTKQLYEDRISQLEQANTFLQDKVLVLRHQLQSHSRLHAKAHRNSSHHSRSILSTKTSQTHLSHLPIPDSENINRDEKNDSNEGLNVDLVENDNRILQLQSELEQNPSDAARVAENIELIRLRRLVKRQSAQLSTLNAHLEVSDKELDQLRSSYNEASIENDQVLKQLMTEKQRLREMQNELIELGNLKQDIKILQEQVRDLQSERTLLRSNNDKLLEIASGKTEEDTSQQLKNNTDKEKIEQHSKEETEKISSKTKEATRSSCSHYQINTILEDSDKYPVSKRAPRIFVKHNLFKELITKAANNYDLDIEPCTEVSLFKAFSHQALSDIFSKQFLRPFTLNYTIMPLTQISEHSTDDKDDEKKNEKLGNENVLGENDVASVTVNDDDKNQEEISKSGASLNVDDDDKNPEERRNSSVSLNVDDDKNPEERSNFSELNLNEAKFVFMQLLKHELENYDSASDQMHNDRLENEEINTTSNSDLEINNVNENSQTENTHGRLPFKHPSSLVDYFWGIVGYKMFFPKKSEKVVEKIEISEHPESTSSDNSESYEPGTSNYDNPPPYYTISISEQSYGTNNSIEGCIVKIRNVDNNQSNWDCNVTKEEPRFDNDNLGSDESQTIEITSYRSINSDLPQKNKEYILNQIETESQAVGDVSPSNSTGMSVSTNQKSTTSELESEIFKEMIDKGEICVIKFKDSDATSNLSITVAHDENKSSEVDKDSKCSDHSQPSIDRCQMVNDSNKCLCNSSPGAGQYILEEHKPDSSRNGIDSAEDNIQNLPDQEKTTFTVYNLNSVTGSKDKIGVLFLKKMSCECNSKSISERQTQNDQSPPSLSNSGTNQFSGNQATQPEQSENFLPNGENKHIPDGDFNQQLLNNDDNETNQPIPVDNGVPSLDGNISKGLDSAPLLTLLRKLLQKLLGDPVNVIPGPRFSVDDGVIESPNTNACDIIESESPNNCDILESRSQSSENDALTRNSKQDNNNTNDIVESPKYSLEPLSASKSFDRNRENSTSKIDRSFQTTSDPGILKFDTKSIETQTYKRRSTDKNEKIDDGYIAGSAQTTKKKTEADSNKQNSNSGSTNSRRPLNRSPDSKTPQSLNDNNYGKPSEVVKTSPSLRGRLPKKMVRESSGKSFESKKQVTPQTRDSLSPNRTKQNNNKLTVNSNDYSRSKTPRKYSREGPRCLPNVQKTFQSPSNQPHICVEGSDVNEVCGRKPYQCYEKHDQAEPNSKLRSAFSKPICSHDRELITNVKKLLELLDHNLDINENHSADEFSNDENESFCNDRSNAFCIPEDDERIYSPQNSSRISSGRSYCNSTQLRSDQTHPQECPTCLNKKLRLQQLNVSNDSPFSKNQKSYDKNNKIDKRLINHEVECDTHQNRPRHPEMIIVVGKKLTIYESDKVGEK